MGKIITPGFAENQANQEAQPKPLMELPDHINVLQIIIDNSDNKHKVTVVTAKPMTVIETLGTLELAKRFMVSEQKPQ